MWKIFKKVVLLWVVVLCLVINLDSSAFSKTDLIVFHAGSLTMPFELIEKAFEEKYPDIDVKRESGGSVKMARLISQIGKPADLMAAADYEVINSMLIPRFASWNIRFATNEMVLCYSDSSRYAQEINAENWYKILERKGVVWGHSDPNIDPCGYRSLMVIQLAERFYKIPGLYDSIINGQSRRIIRPKSVELIALLNTGNLDYAWEYLSVAVQHNLKYVRLPKEINLSDSALDDFYSLARVKIAGKRPGQYVIKKGKSCTYGITILDNARHKKEAVKFLRFLLDPNGGLKILKRLGQPPLEPPVVRDRASFDLLPEQIRPLVGIISSK